ncbi:MAG: hypothetical protein GXW89_19025 [Phycisphaerae bacterium]|nr:hypothetical protein [Phycisphaerae bacterium]
MKKPTTAALLIIAVCLFSLAGCIVPQKPGRGACLYQVEPVTGRGYYLYLPDDYVKHHGQRADGGRWPVMVTFHGMDPWDTAGRQIKECQQEADRYGFLVIAPKLDTSNSLMQYPLKDPNLSYVKRDERAVIAIMDEVFRRTNADPTRVLSTSWSCGGYLAHFMVNRYPERFCCLAVRQSNFSEHLLDPAQVPKYRRMKIGIFFGENDLPACRNESLRAVEWYRQHGFYVEAKLVEGLAHERTPQTAAAFFAASIGVKPKSPPPLGDLVMKDVVPDGDRFRTVNPGQSSNGAGSLPGYSMSGSSDRNIVFGPEQDRQPSRPVSVVPAQPVRRNPPTLHDTTGSTPTPRRPIVPYRF